MTRDRANTSRTIARAHAYSRSAGAGTRTKAAGEAAVVSVLLDDATPFVESEDSKPNDSLRGFDVIDEIKSHLEHSCPATVSGRRRPSRGTDVERAARPQGLARRRQGYRRE
ncbi:peroxidase P7-like [Panicum miliaceum]|uniref:Peroxidase P7-like n=1 Tax=Panicum miliaceum TaxID=4540 RepID=A0A3L6PD68_PANMI|nr:peroxidase P7-like [Panicum miliaceum]